MLQLKGISKHPIAGIHMPSYEIKSKQLNYNDFSVIIAVNTQSEIFVFDLQKGIAVSTNQLT